jgi:L-alanine-DL-glutamate epimerase-like enolase superfamily enzyme
MSASIVALDSYDVRFPTSRQLDGSDAMHPDPDYSAAYVVVRTDAADGHRGDGFAFTIGRGNEVQLSAISYLQLDAARVAGVNENVAIVLLAAKFGVPVCPHAGGAGLCELVQHLSMFDYVAVSGSMEDRVIEYVDPVVIRGGRYRAPLAPGFSATMRPETLVAYAYPDGPVWLAEGRRP